MLKRILKYPFAKLERQVPDFELTIRIGTPADYPAALEVQRRAYRQKEVPLYGTDLPPLKETPETLAQEVAEGKTLLVGEHDGRVVASIRTKILEDGSVYFCRLSVDPDLQGKGIGQRMALAVEEFNPEAPAIVLDCGDKSAENRHIYTKLGFQLTGNTFQVPDGPFCLEMRKTRKQEKTNHV